jgi:hypothetical protein
VVGSEILGVTDEGMDENLRGGDGTDEGSEKEEENFRDAGFSEDAPDLRGK